MTLEILCVLTALTAIASLVIAMVTFSSRFDQIQTARQRSAFDSCQTLGGLILRSGKLTGHEARARAFLSQAGLANCRAYSLRVRRGTL